MLKTDIKKTFKLINLIGSIAIKWPEDTTLNNK